MLKIGLTGGIGSGKSTVAKAFVNLGVPVFYADNQAKKILCSNAVKENLREQWGSSVFFDNGDVNKAALAKIVFNDSKELKILNSFIHPKLMEAFNKWASEKEKSQNKYVIMEAAILFEASFDKNVDKTICVSAPLNNRIERVIKRDNVIKADVIARMNSQWSQEEVIAKSNYEIKNADEDMILDSIIKLHYSFSS